MPASFIGAFDIPFSTGSVPAWRWSDGDEDADFLDFIEFTTGRNQNYSVDRTGADPVLRWEIWVWDPNTQTFSDTGAVDSLILYDGALLLQDGFGGPSVPRGVDHARSVLPACWESDHYGRPSRLEDLLAE